MKKQSFCIPRIRGQICAWNFRDIPRDLMRKVKMAAAHEGKTVKEFLIELAEVRIQELERKGILPKPK